MKYLLFTIALLTAPFVHAAKDCSHSKTRFNCVEYIKNYDGDTITFKIPNTHPLLGEKISVRVDGVDTAEIKTQNTCEKQASRTARKLVKNLMKNAKRIDLHNVKRGKYFRIVADVIYDGKNLKDILLKNNLGYVYSGKTKPVVDWCAKIRLPAAE